MRGNLQRSTGPDRRTDGDGAPRCQIWGVLNVTPDSFSDGGLFLDRAAALTQAEHLVRSGADVVDVGGESTRPAGREYGSGATAVGLSEELRRIMPVVEHLVSVLGARVSVDTTKPGVARRALAEGAAIVNDVSCGTIAELLDVTAEAGAELVLMHNRGRGEVSPDNVRYADVVAEVIEELLGAVQRAVAAGVREELIWIDPGVGFAKTAAQSVELVARTAELVATGQPVLVGTSRKSFIAELAPAPDGARPPPMERDGGTAATVVAAVLAGARGVRVHDVAAMRQAVRVAEALRACSSGRAA